MKILVFGLGSIGLRHVRILKKNFDYEIACFRSGFSSVDNDVNIKELKSWDEVKNFKADVALITNPTYRHVETAMECVDHGMHVFIEKPLSDSLENLAKLKKMASRLKRKCYVGYGLRFHPVVKLMKTYLMEKDIFHVRASCSSYLPDWRSNPSTAYYSAFKDQGGGVVMDVSHEVDYLYYLFNDLMVESVSSGKRSTVTVDAEDYVDALLSSRVSKIPINLHLNFLSHLKERWCKVDFKGGYLHADFLSNTLLYVDSQGQSNHHFEINRDEILLAQWKYFFSQLRNPTMMNDLDEAIPLVDVLLKLRDGGSVVE